MKLLIVLMESDCGNSRSKNTIRCGLKVEAIATLKLSPSTSGTYASLSTRWRKSHLLASQANKSLKVLVLLKPNITNA